MRLNFLNGFAFRFWHKEADKQAIKEAHGGKNGENFRRAVVSQHAWKKLRQQETTTPDGAVPMAAARPRMRFGKISEIMIQHTAPLPEAKADMNTSTPLNMSQIADGGRCILQSASLVSTVKSGTTRKICARHCTSEPKPISSLRPSRSPSYIESTLKTTLINPMMFWKTCICACEAPEFSKIRGP